MLETLPLTDEERLAAESVAEALEALAIREAKVPVPADCEPGQATILPLQKMGNPHRRD